MVHCLPVNLGIEDTCNLPVVSIPAISKKMFVGSGLSPPTYVYNPVVLTNSTSVLLITAFHLPILGSQHMWTGYGACLLVKLCINDTYNVQEIFSRKF